MLHKRTSSAANLRMQNSRRHSIRNLKAKVRALLPIDICPRQNKRQYNNLALKQSTHISLHNNNYFSQCLNKQKKTNKIFEKLSKKEIEEINQNKHYFLGSEQNIAFYQSYVRQTYPQMVQHQWASPQILKNNIFPLAFIPFNMNTHELYHKAASEKRLFRKRSSIGRSFGIQKKQSIPYSEFQFQIKQEQPEQQIINYKRQTCLTRKQAIQEQVKIKKEISYGNLQRQQLLAEQKREKFLKERMEKAKYSRYNSSFSSKYDKRSWVEDKFMENDLLNMATKLRRVCLLKKKIKSQKQIVI